MPLGRGGTPTHGHLVLSPVSVALRILIYITIARKNRGLNSLQQIIFPLSFHTMSQPIVHLVLLPGQLTRTSGAEVALDKAS